MTELPQCRCCRVPIVPRFGPVRMRLRVCPLCDICDERHGHDLHEEIARRWAAGKMDPWLAVACSAFDDAWLCGKLEIDQATGSAWVREPPKRWEVVFAWARARKGRPALDPVMEAVLAPYLGRRDILQRFDDIRRDALAAVHAFDSNLVDVRVEIERDPNDANSIDVRIMAKSPHSEVSEEVSARGGDLIEVPADVWSRPRGQA